MPDAVVVELTDLIGGGRPIEDAPPCPMYSEPPLVSGDVVYDRKRWRWRFRDGKMIGCIHYDGAGKVSMLWGGNY